MATTQTKREIDLQAVPQERHETNLVLNPIVAELGEIETKITKAAAAGERAEIKALRARQDELQDICCEIAKEASQRLSAMCEALMPIINPAGPRFDKEEAEAKAAVDELIREHEQQLKSARRRIDEIQLARTGLFRDYQAFSELAAQRQGELSALIARCVAAL